MNRFSKLLCPGLAVLFASSEARADHGTGGEPWNMMAGPVLGIYRSGGETRGLFGLEGGVGYGPERVNAGVSWRRVGSMATHERFGYLEFDPWFVIGGSFGVGYGEQSGRHTVLGVWEGIPLTFNDCTDGDTIITISIGYRYTGVHEVYLAPKVGYGAFPCFGGGRPLRDGDALVLPAAVAARRGVVARRWIDAARLEASSVASFVRLASELEAADAPAVLARGARAAAADEVRHAELCARVGGGAALASPPAAPPRLAPTRAAALARLATEAWHEGCLGEGVAAAEADDAASRARETSAAFAQRTIARDEARHAELSWAIVRWAWRAGGAGVRDAIADAISSTRQAAPALAGASADEDLLAWHGLPIDATIGERVTEAALRRAARQLGA